MGAVGALKGRLMQPGAQLTRQAGEASGILHGLLQPCREGGHQSLDRRIGLFGGDAEPLSEVLGCTAALRGLKNVLQVRHTLSLPIV